MPGAWNDQNCHFIFSSLKMTTFNLPSEVSLANSSNFPSKLPTELIGMHWHKRMGWQDGPHPSEVKKNKIKTKNAPHPPKEYSRRKSGVTGAMARKYCPLNSCLPSWGLVSHIHSCRSFSSQDQSLMPTVLCPLDSPLQVESELWMNTWGSFGWIRKSQRACWQEEGRHKK